MAEEFYGVGVKVSSLDHRPLVYLHPLGAEIGINYNYWTAPPYIVSVGSGDVRIEIVPPFCHKWQYSSEHGFEDHKDGLPHGDQLHGGGGRGGAGKVCLNHYFSILCLLVIECDMENYPTFKVHLEVAEGPLHDPARET